MKITPYGTRGSIATPSDSSQSTHCFGGNTTCCLVQAGGGIHIIDAGTGIRTLGIHLMRDYGFKDGGRANIYITHTHWDHIQGFPFFSPAYNPKNKITLYGEAQIEKVMPTVTGNGDNLKIRPDLEETVRRHPDKGTTVVMKVKGNGIKDVLMHQQDFRNFPVTLEALRAMDYVDFIPEKGPIVDTATLCVETLRVPHPGGCIAYRFTEKVADGYRRFVFCSDFEPEERHIGSLVRFWKDADVVIADAQYEPPGTVNTPNPFMKGWGHSDYKTDIDIAAKAGVKRLFLTHHEPRMDDIYHADLEKRAQEYAPPSLQVALAREGTTLACD